MTPPKPLKQKKNSSLPRKSVQLNFQKPTLTADSKPVSASVYYQQALQTYHVSQWEEACRIAELCIAASHNDVSMRINAMSLCAAALMMMHQQERALELWLEIDKKMPTDVSNLSNIGMVLIQFQRYSEAIEYLQRAVNVAPHYDSYLNLGFACYQCGLVTQAKASYQQALICESGSIQGRFNLADIFQEEGSIDEAHQLYEQILKIDPKNVHALGIMVFLQHFRYPLDLQRQMKSLQHYGQRFIPEVQQPQSHQTTLQSHSPLRIGFISPDLRQHPVGYFLEQTLEQLRFDPILSDRVVLIAYHNNSVADEYTHRLRVQFDLWYQVNDWSDNHLVEQIRRDQINILIDLSGHTVGNRLPVFAMKPAPLQVSWLGYYGSTGLSSIDYVLADPICVPTGEERYFIEKIWRFPSLRYCFSVPKDAPEVSLLPSLQSQQFVFGCYQTLSKINPGVLQCWKRILSACPRARLRIQLRELVKAEARELFKIRLERSGIDLQRIDLVSAMMRSDYLASYAEVDVLLDTFPFPGGTTTAEALWMGVPTLTLAAPSMLGRQGEALMESAGLSDWVVYSEEEYVQKAIDWANSDVPRRQELAILRAGIRERVRHSPVFNAKQFAHDFVDALYGMWQAKVDTLKE